MHATLLPDRLAPVARTAAAACRAGALAALVVGAAWPGAVAAQLVTLLPTGGSSLSAMVVLANGQSLGNSSGPVQTPSPEASVLATGSGVDAVGGSAYTLTSFANAIQTVTQNLASGFSMTFYSGSTYSVSALSLSGVSATSVVQWFQRLSLATDSIVTLTHLSTPPLPGESTVPSQANAAATLALSGAPGSGFPLQLLGGLTGVQSGVSFTAPAGTYLLGSRIERQVNSIGLAGGSAVTDTFQSITVTPVPEPATWALMLGGAAALLACRRAVRRRG
jgi:hypothetical protein